MPVRGDRIRETGEKIFPMRGKNTGKSDVAQDIGGNGSGPLRTVLETAAADGGYSLREPTVLALHHDPYRFDTPSGHSSGRWVASVIEQLVPGHRSVHLRGLHYLLVSAPRVKRPDNRLRYTNTEENWDWLSRTASKAAVWLGYVPFSRIIDERNEAPEIFVPERPGEYFGSHLSCGIDLTLPGLESVLPSLWCTPFEVEQPYRIVLFGEKTSLGPVLRPIAEGIGAEMLLPTGESSTTMVADCARRCALDGRPSAVLYFSDFDPSGRQMAISVSRKFQALRDLRYPELNIQLHAVALTLEQVRRLSLPSTPLKETERRADRWRTVMGHEQTEIDALAALQPGTLRQIALEAIAPFYDDTLAHRSRQAQEAWHAEAKERLQSDPAYHDAVERLRSGLTELEASVEAFRLIQSEILASLRAVRGPRIVLPEVELDGNQPRPLFTTEDDFITATRRLIDHKRLDAGVDEP